MQNIKPHGMPLIPASPEVLHKIKNWQNGHTHILRSYLGKIPSREPKDLGSSFWYQNVCNRLSCQPCEGIVTNMHSFTQFEKTYDLAFLNILGKCDFLEKITLGPCRL